MLSSMLRVVCIVGLLTIGGSPFTANAQPDIDGAVHSLISVPLDVAGDGLGGAGLVAASVIGFTGNVAAVIDNNQYTHILLRGILSTPIRRLAYGTSRMSSGMLEGLTNDDYVDYPQGESAYLKSNVDARIGTLADGVGAMVLGVVDGVGNTAQFLLRLPGITDMADDVAKMQSDMRRDLVGDATDGKNDTETYQF